MTRTPNGEEQMAEQSRDLAAHYWSFMESIIDEDGVEIPYAIIINAGGDLDVMMLAVSPDQAYRVVLAEIAKGAREAIFALDRFTKPGQGTKYSDVLAGHHFTGPALDLRRENFRPFVIEYRPSPKLVEPICWDNQFWNGALRHELQQTAANMLADSGAAA